MSETETKTRSERLKPLPKPHMWALLDCNTFYCSCERLFRPDLNGKPVVVLSNNDGCLIALTPEAKALGFKMGDIYHLRAAELRQKKVEVFSSNYTLYGDISRRVMATLESVVPAAVEQYSIDEAFIPFDRALAVQALEVGWAMHDRVSRWVGVPVRVGLGPTKTLAKLANSWAKKINRVLWLKLNSRELEDVLNQTPVGEIWGIGRALSARLTALGLTNARQLRDMGLSQAKKLLSLVGQRTVMELRGIQCISETREVRQTLVSSRSFGRAVTKKEDLMEALARHCTLAAARLRAEGLEAGGLSVYLRTSRHASSPFFEAGATVYLSSPTNDTSELIKSARVALDRGYRPGHCFLKGGLMLFQIQVEGQSSKTLLDLVDGPGVTRPKELMKSIDRINDKYGPDAIHFFQGVPKALWHMKRDRLSGQMTTNWSELPQVS